MPVVTTGTGAANRQRLRANGDAPLDLQSRAAAHARRTGYIPERRAVGDRENTGGDQSGAAVTARSVEHGASRSQLGQGDGARRGIVIVRDRPGENGQIEC